MLKRCLAVLINIRCDLKTGALLTGEKKYNIVHGVNVAILVYLSDQNFASPKG
jgi:hypothetical protein